MLTDALERALARDDWKLFRAGIDKLARDFAAGQPDARQMVFERIEGKVAQRIEHDSTDTRALSLQDVVRLVMQARALDAEDAVIVSPSTLAAPSQAPRPQGDTPMEEVGGEGVVRVAPLANADQKTDPPGAA